MLYIIYGIYKSVISKNSKTITKKVLGEEINELNFTKIDYTNTSLKNLETEISFLPFGYDKKVLLIENCEDIVKEKDLANFIDLINSNEEVDVILTANVAKFNHSTFEAVNNKKIIEIKELTDSDWDKYIVQYLQKQGVTIEKEAVIELKKRVNYDLESLISEMDKISNYSNYLTKKDIILLVNEPLNENSFDLLTFLIENKKELALKTYKDLIVKNNDPIMLISMLSSQLKFLNTVFYLSKIEKKSKDEIASILKVSSGRIYYTLKSVKKLTQKIIDDSFERLYTLDKNIKLSLVDKYIGFELFILNFGG